MEIKDLYGVVLLFILTAMVIGVGVLTLDKFGTSVKTTAGGTTNETIAISSGLGTTANDEIQSITYFGNTSLGGSTNGAYTVGVHVNITADKAHIKVANFSNGNYDVSYTYLSDSKATDAAESGRAEVSAIATTWLGLIITIAVLALIIGLVVSSFGFGKGQR